MGAGGSNETTQTIEVVNERVSKVVQQTIMEKSVHIQQDAKMSQLMKNVSIISQPGCPAGKTPSVITVSQNMATAQSVALTLNNTTANELAQVVTNELEAVLKSEVDKEKKGSLVNTDQTTTNQNVKLSNKSQSLVESTIRTTLNTYVNQSQSMDQNMQNISVMIPCGASLNISQESLATMVANDIGTNASGIVTKMDEFNTLSGSATAIDKQKVTDTFAALADSFAGMLSSLGLSGAMGMVAVAVIVVVIIIIVMIVLSKVGGGGGGGGDSDSLF